VINVSSRGGNPRRTLLPGGADVGPMPVESLIADAVVVVAQGGVANINQTATF
jgi:hypothetical protein